MADRPARKVLLIGWDSADWKLIHPLVDGGEMPAMARFIERGAIGNLASMRPLLSPMLWTSIATGKRPDKHGVLGFYEPDPERAGVRPYGSTTRKTKALWNILSQAGLKTHTVGWLASHPAERINGVCVSNLFQHEPGGPSDPWPLGEGIIHPENLRGTMADLRVRTADIDGSALLQFVARAAEVDQAWDTRLLTLARLLAQCVTVHNAATWILEHREWDFLAVYYDALDHFGHAFMRYHPPRMQGIPEREFEFYRDVVRNAYRFHDMMLARLVQLAGPDSTIVMVSDHGFHSDHLRPAATPRVPAGAAVWHRNFGLFAAAGPGLIRDEVVHGASVLDVTPTILAMFGLPVAADMDGRVLRQIFEQPPAVEIMGSWDDVPGECGMRPEAAAMEPAEAQAILSQFAALGYIEPPGPDQTRAIETAVLEADYNLAQVFLGSVRPALALPLLEKLTTSAPGNCRYELALSQCYFDLGRREDASRLLDQLLEREPELARAELLLGIIRFEQDRTGEALALLVEAEKTEPRLPGLHVRIGDAYARVKRWRDAGRAYRKALDIDGDNPAAHLGLAWVNLRRRRYQAAADEAMTAVGLTYDLPAGHYCLGLALDRLGHIERARLAMQTVRQFAPGHPYARRWLAAHEA